MQDLQNDGPMLPGPSFSRFCIFQVLHF